MSSEYESLLTGPLHFENLTYAQAPLLIVRGYSKDGMRDDVKQFLIDTAAVPEEAIVVMTPESFTLLVDDEGHLLAFR